MLEGGPVLSFNTTGSGVNLLSIFIAIITQGFQFEIK